MFKNHFISILYCADLTFLANQWDRLIKQTVMTINMVWRSWINPRLSSYQQIWGSIDFNRTPMGIPGCKAMVHLRPRERPFYSTHGVLGFYVEPSMHKFRNFTCYVPTKRNNRDSNIVQFYPGHTQMPTTSSTDQLAVVIEDLITVLQNPYPPTPFLQVGNPTNNAIRQLRIIFNVSNGTTDTNNNINTNRPNHPLGTDQEGPKVSNRINNCNNNTDGNNVPTIILMEIQGCKSRHVIIIYFQGC